MSIKSGAGYLNWLYRIFVEVEDIDNENRLSINSTDPVERELAKASEENEREYEKHFNEKNNRLPHFKVGKEDLKEVEKTEKQENQKGQVEREER